MKKLSFSQHNGKAKFCYHLKTRFFAVVETELNVWTFFWLDMKH